MNGFNHPAAFVVRWILVGLFLLGIMNSFATGYRLAPDACAVLLALALAAAAAVWVQNRHSWRWTQAAFLILGMGMLRLLIACNEFSRYGAVILIVAAIAMKSRHYWLNGRASAGRSTGNIAAEAETSRHAVQPAQPTYSFDQNVQYPRYRFADVVGMSETKKRLLAAGEEIVRGGSKRNGVILFGEPGNGKTLFAEALAGELKVPFMAITYGDLASKWINETPQKIEAMFRTARRVGVCVLFLDEADSPLKKRDDDGSHSMDRDMANVMLTNINNLHGTRVVLVVATNFIDKLDAAAIREGRFDFKIEVPAPDMEAREAILRKTIGDSLGFSVVDRVAVTSLAERWAGFSASRLASIGGQLAEMRRDGKFGAGKVTFDLGMQAMRLLQGRKGKLPEGVKSIDEIIMPAESRDALRDMAYKMKNVHNLEKMGGSLPPGVIYFGPPGTGKTEAAMALAKASGWAFLSTTGANLMARPDAWGKLVREAQDIRPAIVFIDESDTVLQDRRHSNVELLTNEILVTVSGTGGKVRDVMYIAATNHYDRLDKAVLRGGRFEEKVRFGVPQQEDMRLYVSRKLASVTRDRYAVASGVLDRCIAELAGRSIADADALIHKSINTAAVRALRENVAHLCVADVIAAARLVFAKQSDTTARR
ncbi:transitional endoplasmic reticulum ATPase [Paraburkholderia sp. GAS41]|uniref:AAA family ATPase n=1 Tax=Paraburkholderia sp. GAS41 TaxID=3035134 RepID=UPI003D23A9D9